MKMEVMRTQHCIRRLIQDGPRSAVGAAGRRSQGKGAVHGSYKEKGVTWDGEGEVLARENQASGNLVEGATKDM